MARRTGLPPEIRAELPQRSRAGIGHDADYLTQIEGNRVSARHACRIEPSRAMKTYAQQVQGFLRAQGAEHVSMCTDYRQEGAIGAITIRWTTDVPAALVAAEFAVSTASDGTPRIPSWLNLRPEHDWDMRWQPAY